MEKQLNKHSGVNQDKFELYGCMNEIGLKCIELLISFFYIEIVRIPEMLFDRLDVNSFDIS